MATEVVITDYFSASNRGDAAILEGVMNTIQSHIPDPNFTVITENTAAAELLHGINAVEQQISPQQWLSWFKNGAVKSNLSYDAATTYHSADLIVSTGGHHITDTYLPAKLGMLAELYYCTLLSCPVVLFSQTIGPVKKRVYRPIVRKVLNKVDLITVRDNRSLSVLREIGVTEPDIEFTGDAAFALPDSPPRNIPLIEKKTEGIPQLTEHQESPVITVSIRPLEEFINPSQECQFRNSIASALTQFGTRRDATIIFASTCTNIAEYHKDDREVGMDIVELINGGNSKVLYGEYTPFELTRIYEQADIHIGTRMHSCLQALLAGTPVVSLEYQFKVAGLMSQLGLEEYNIPVTDVNTNVLHSLIEEVYDNRSDIKELIDEEVRKKQHNVLESGDSLLHLEI